MAQLNTAALLDSSLLYSSPYGFQSYSAVEMGQYEILIV